MRAVVFGRKDLERMCFGLNEGVECVSCAWQNGRKFYTAYTLVPSSQAEPAGVVCSEWQKYWQGVDDVECASVERTLMAEPANQVRTIYIVNARPTAALYDDVARLMASRFTTGRDAVNFLRFMFEQVNGKEAEAEGWGESPFVK